MYSIAYKLHHNESIGSINNIPSSAPANTIIEKLQARLRADNHATGITWQVADNFIRALASSVKL